MTGRGYPPFVIVYFTVEMSGGTLQELEIWHIGAKCGANIFSIYINPTTKGEKHARKANGLDNINKELHFQGVKVESWPLAIVLERFYKFLEDNVGKGNKAVLVSHAAKICHRHRFGKACYITENFRERFRAVIESFSDSDIKIATSLQKGPQQPEVKLNALERHIAEKALEHKVSVEEYVLPPNGITYVESFERVCIRAGLRLKLSPLQSKSAKKVLDKLVEAEMSYEKLQQKYDEEGSAGVQAQLHSLDIKNGTTIMIVDDIILKLKQISDELKRE